MALPATVERVPAHTAPAVNRAIRRQTADTIAYFRSNPAQVPSRLKALDREWDVERALAAGSSCLSLAGLALGLLVSHRWLALPLAVQGFYLQHTLQGWCPPLPIFRRLGFRTPAEIEGERCALTAIRDGDEAASRGRSSPRTDDRDHG